MRSKSITPLCPLGILLAALTALAGCGNNLGQTPTVETEEIIATAENAAEAVLAAQYGRENRDTPYIVTGESGRKMSSAELQPQEIANTSAALAARLGNLVPGEVWRLEYVSAEKAKLPHGYYSALAYTDSTLKVQIYYDSITGDVQFFSQYPDVTGPAQVYNEAAANSEGLSISEAYPVLAAEVNTWLASDDCAALAAETLTILGLHGTELSSDTVPLPEDYAEAREQLQDSIPSFGIRVFHYALETAQDNYAVDLYIDGKLRLPYRLETAVTGEDSTGAASARSGAVTLWYDQDESGNWYPVYGDTSVEADPPDTPPQNDAAARYVLWYERQPNGDLLPIYSDSEEGQAPDSPLALNEEPLYWLMVDDAYWSPVYGSDIGLEQPAPAYWEPADDGSWVPVYERIIPQATATPIPKEEADELTGGETGTRLTRNGDYWYLDY